MNPFKQLEKKKARLRADCLSAPPAAPSESICEPALCPAALPQVLSTVERAGLLSAAEKAGLSLSKIEKLVSNRTRLRSWSTPFCLKIPFEGQQSLPNTTSLLLPLRRCLL